MTCSLCRNSSQSVLQCDAVRLYTRRKEVGQDLQTLVWCFSAEAGTRFPEVQAHDPIHEPRVLVMEPDEWTNV